MMKNPVPGAEGEVRLHPGHGAESHALGAQGRQLRTRVDHGKIFRLLAVENTQFRGTVGSQVRVAVEMVCAEVGPDRYPGTENIRCFQLERADFNDRGIKRTAPRGHLAERQPDIAAGLGFDSRRIEQRGNQTGRGCLAVRAGHRHHGAEATTEGQFNFAEERDTGLNRPARERHHGINPGAQHREVELLHAAQRVIPQDDACATRGKCFGGFSPRGGIPGIEHGDRGAVRQEEPRGRLAAPAEAEHGGMFSRVVHGNHRSFKVASPRRAKMTERIQKRTMTVPSFQPLSSK